DKIDEQVSRLEARGLRQQFGCAGEEVSFLLRLAPGAQRDLYQHDVIGSVDAQIARIVHESIGLKLGDDLEAVVLGHREGLHHGPMDTLSDSTAVLSRLAGPERDAHKGHGGATVAPPGRRRSESTRSVRARQTHTLQSRACAGSGSQKSG